MIQPDGVPGARRRSSWAQRERSVPMHTTDARLTPIERLREVAAILATGILRLRTIPTPAPEAAYSPTSEPEKLLDSGQKALEVSATHGPHVPPI